MTTPPTLHDLPDHAEALGPSLVRVEGGRRRSATGVPWREPGTVVTALHAVERDDTALVTLPDGATLQAQVVGRDASLDLALLRLPEDAASPTLALAWRSLEGLRVAEPVLALGRPGASVRAAFGVLGVVAGTVRLGTGGVLERYVELDRQLPRGFSGSLVLDLERRVVGLAMRGIVRGASVVLGEATLSRVLGQLAEHGHVRRGYIGVGVHPARLPTAHAERLGRGRALIVVALEDDGPATKAGVTLGDVIVAVDDDAVTTPLELRAALEDRAAQRVTISLLRGGAQTTVEVEPGLRA